MPLCGVERSRGCTSARSTTPTLQSRHFFLFGRRLSASSSRPRPSCSSAPQVKPLLLTVGDKAQRCVCVCGWAAVGANTLHTRTRARARITSQRRWPEVSRPRALSFNHPRPGFSIGSVPQFGFESVFTMTGKKLEEKKKKKPPPDSLWM